MPSFQRIKPERYKLVDKIEDFASSNYYLQYYPDMMLIELLC